MFHFRVCVCVCKEKITSLIFIIIILKSENLAFVIKTGNLLKVALWSTEWSHFYKYTHTLGIHLFSGFTVSHRSYLFAILSKSSLFTYRGPLESSFSERGIPNLLFSQWILNVSSLYISFRARYNKTVLVAYRLILIGHLGGFFPLSLKRSFYILLIFDLICFNNFILVA